ncbi:hypothetical protein FE257_000159 [Aspergillus nanangensis]|uniref:Zn(2)-C6 fungal-type domain-containing protein n=1 Tax=Aspergillus nanangensis TaxID=2582783 RepID=A0AAD4GZP1_ASPNN|nr:hypothetical protein FE257_000159 [Aspergillus nanangensis]
MTHKDRPVGRRRVKSGCQTCRIRKVKCDESFPSCRRCLSTGRKCDGYGIWGGGATTTSSTQDSIVVFQPGYRPGLVTSKQEGDCFQWFTSRSVIKLPGTFSSEFWSTLLLQASQSEPAVLHAVLALSSAHRRGILVDNQLGTEGEAEFTSQNYIKSIRHLQPHFQTKDRTAFRVALIVCVVFVSLEFLRGHFTSAQMHLQMGLNLLAKSNIQQNADHSLSGLGREFVDDWIVQAFWRLHIQHELFNQVHRESSFLLDTCPLHYRSSIFTSVNDAWDQLQRLMGSLFYLTREARQQQALGHGLSLDLSQLHTDIQEGSAQWLDIYTVTIQETWHRMSSHVLKLYDLLRVYHTMITIMTATCLHVGDEMIFDQYTHQFIHMISILADMWKFIAIHGTYRSRPTKFAMSRSVVDMCWIPPLYYTAIKCRVHRVRLHSIRLLETSFHREGLWDSQIAAFAARKAMSIEEGDFYELIDAVDDFPLSSPPTSDDLLFPPLPESCRLRDVRIEVPGNPCEVISLFSRDMCQSSGHDVLIAEYRLSNEEIIDGG